MTKCQSSMRSEDQKPQVKYKGIHEPKGRVKGYRVEIRPPNSTGKIWVGTFETRLKAMRAFDAAVYLTGKDPYYFLYPENYFPTRPKKAEKEFVQTEAKKFAERTDDLKFNPTSFLVDNSRASSVEELVGSTSGAGSEQITPIAPDVKTAVKMDVVGLDEFLQNTDYLPAPAELTPLEVNSFWISWMEGKTGLGEAKAGVEEVKAGAELAAFDRGYNDPDIAVLSDLLVRDPPENFFPFIEGGSFIPVYTPSRPSSKRKRETAEGAFSFTDDSKSLGLSESGAADLDDLDWLQDFRFDPVKQPFDWLGTDEPPFW